METNSISENGHTDAASSHSEAESRTAAHRQRRAILIVLASFTLTFTGYGLNFPFGVYQDLYTTPTGPFPHAHPASIDFVGTLTASLMTIGAPLASTLTTTHSPRPVILADALLATSTLLASFSTRL
ncbi:hypothetical protein AOQ84DRAFT_436335 [Glonium stellatum]|uniref:Major facilitator superfamily (MFS) profile domain-containing protein n=1 Tax=Glonium stellatum TaxID=574774 RepID=A0A8E2JY24_9PEZI|nr:hypothetical protein AOQ84DRAFT_436335 [Glonium stellatum]